MGSQRQNAVETVGWFGAVGRSISTPQSSSSLTKSLSLPMTLPISTCKLKLSFTATITDVPTTSSMPPRSSSVSFDFVTSLPSAWMS
ncbi:hypothetical protein ACFX1S_020146 [Malus domestica]